MNGSPARPARRSTACRGLLRAALCTSLAVGAAGILTLDPAWAQQQGQDGYVPRPLRLTPSADQTKPSGQVPENQAPGAAAAPPAGFTLPGTGPVQSPSPAVPGGATTAAEQSPPAGGITSEPLSFETAAPGEASVPAVAGDALESMDPASVGTLADQSGGLGAGLWAGSDRALITELIAGLTGQPGSPMLRDLQRRLLLTAAQAPASAVDEADGFLQARIDRLRAMGELQAMGELIAKIEVAQASTPTTVASTESNFAVAAPNPRFRQLQLEALLLDGDLSGACEVIGSQSNGSPDADPLVEKQRIFCLTLNKRNTEAALAADLLRELGHDDPVFFAMVDVLAGFDAAPVESLPEPTALHLAMMRAAGLSIPSDVLNSDDPAIIRAVALSDNAEPDVRLKAADQALAVGLLSPEELQTIVEGLRISAQDVGTARGLAARVQTTLQARAQTAPTAKAEAISLVLRSGQADDAYAQAAALVTPLLQDIEPSADLAWFAVDAGRALYRVGDYDRARAWLEISLRAAASNLETYGVMLRLWPIARLARGDQGLLAWDERMVAAWMQNDRSAIGEDAHPVDRLRAVERAELLLGLFDALGEPLTANDWASVRQDRQAMPSASGPPRVIADVSVWSALRHSLSGGRLGESLLWLLHMTQERTLTELHPVQLSAVIGALRQLGLENEARGAAVEAAIAAGV